MSGFILFLFGFLAPEGVGRELQTAEAPVPLGSVALRHGFERLVDHFVQAWLLMYGAGKAQRFAQHPRGKIAERYGAGGSSMNSCRSAMLMPTRTSSIARSNARADGDRFSQRTKLVGVVSHVKPSCAPSNAAVLFTTV